MNKFDQMRSRLTTDFKGDKNKQTVAKRGIDHAEEWAAMKGLSDGDFGADCPNCDTLKKECTAYVKAQLKEDRKKGMFGSILGSILLSIFFQVIVSVVVKWIINYLFS